MRECLVLISLMIAALTLVGCHGGPATATVTGMVRDITTDGAIQGPQVSTTGISDTTGADGRFELTGVPTGDQAITVAAPTGYVMTGQLWAVELGERANGLQSIYLAPVGDGLPAPPPQL